MKLTSMEGTSRFQLRILGFFFFFFFWGGGGGGIRIQGLPSQERERGDGRCTFLLMNHRSSASLKKLWLFFLCFFFVVYRLSDQKDIYTAKIIFFSFALVWFRFSRFWFRYNPLYVVLILSPVESRDLQFDTSLYSLLSSPC